GPCSTAGNSCSTIEPPKAGPAFQPDLQKGSHMAPLRRLGVGLLILAAGFGGRATAGDEKPAPQPIRVLFVGNSQIYFNDLPKILEGIAESAPKDRLRIRTGRAVYGGATL